MPREEVNAYNRAYYAANRQILRDKANARRPPSTEAQKAKYRENTRNARLKDPERAKRKAAEYRASNRDKIRAYMIKWYADNIEKGRAYGRKHGVGPVAKERERLRRLNDPAYRLLKNCRIRIWESLRKCSAKKLHRTHELLGCTPQLFRDYIEKQCTFENGFTWQNYGTRWEVDHIIPVAKFHLLDLDQRKRCFHYSNCQPLGKIDNIKKGDKLPHELNLGLVKIVRSQKEVASFLPADVAV